MELLKKIQEEIQKFSKVPRNKSVGEKAEQELESTAANLGFIEANTKHSGWRQAQGTLHEDSKVA